jgi:hypothetical protein
MATTRDDQTPDGAYPSMRSLRRIDSNRSTDTPIRASIDLSFESRVDDEQFNAERVVEADGDREEIGRRGSAKARGRGRR